MEKNQDHILNRLHQSIAKIVIGEIPVSFDEKDAPARETINGLITSFLAPGLSLRYETDSNYKAKVHVSVQEENEYNDKILSISMIVDDRAKNWWCIYRYMKTLQSIDDGFPVLDTNHRVYGKDGHYRNRLLYIPNIDIIIADGSFERHQIIQFKRCFPITMSDIQFNSSSSDVVTFTVNFVYSDRDVIIEPEPSADIIPPLSISD